MPLPISPTAIAFICLGGTLLTLLIAYVRFKQLEYRIVEEV